MNGPVPPLMLSPKPCYQARDITAKFLMPVTDGTNRQ